MKAVERQRSDLAREVENLNKRLNQRQLQDWAQLKKKRDAELNKLRKDVKEANIQREATTASMKKKQQDAVMEMNEQIE